MISFAICITDFSSSYPSCLAQASSSSLGHRNSKARHSVHWSFSSEWLTCSQQTQLHISYVQQISGPVKKENNMKPQNLTALSLLSQQVSYRPHLSMEEIPNLGNFSVNKPVTNEPKGAQLTIFYGGEIIVFDDIAAEKAKEIMSFASKGNSKSQNNYSHTFTQSHPSFPSPNVVRSPAAPTPAFPFLIPNGGNNLVEEHPQAPPRSVVCGLPLARKASLHRFLEKRKDRIAARAPYQTSSPMSWLAMVPKSPEENSETSSSVV